VLATLPDGSSRCEGWQRYQLLGSLTPNGKPRVSGALDVFGWTQYDVQYNILDDGLDVGR